MTPEVFTSAWASTPLDTFNTPSKQVVGIPPSTPIDTFDTPTKQVVGIPPSTPIDTPDTSGAGVSERTTKEPSTPYDTPRHPAQVSMASKVSSTPSEIKISNDSVGVGGCRGCRGGDGQIHKKIKRNARACKNKDFSVFFYILNTYDFDPSFLSKIFCVCKEPPLDTLDTPSEAPCQGEEFPCQGEEFPFLKFLMPHRPEIFPVVTAVDDVPVLTVETPEAFAVLAMLIASRADNVLALDTETTGLDPHTADLALIQIHYAGCVWLIDYAALKNTPTLEFIQRLMFDILADEGLMKLGHNLKFDIKFLLRHLWPRDKGSPLAVAKNRPWCRNLFDTYLAELLLTAGIGQRGQHNLKHLAKKYAGVELSKDKSVRLSFGSGGLSQEQIEYAARDVLVLHEIKDRQIALLKAHSLVDVARMEFEVLQPVAEMELHGTVINRAALDAVKGELRQRCHTLELELAGLVGRGDVNFRSPAQVAGILAGMGHPVASTASEVLEKIDTPFAKALLAYRDATKQLTGFAEAITLQISPATGRLHPEFSQLGTDTGRFTCRKPNLQQIPATESWRSLFSAPDGYSVATADYSQIELRILAEYSQDPVFIDAYQTGQDLHTRTASEMFHIPLDQVQKPQRNAAKAINFGLAYGMAAPGLAVRLGCHVEEAEEAVQKYFKAYPKVKECLERLAVEALTKKYSLTLSGRKRFYEDVHSRKDIGSVSRKGKNSPIQGTCGDILKKALTLITIELGCLDYPAWISNTVHDEVVVSAPDEHIEEVAGIVKECMVDAGRLYIKSVPVEVECNIAKTWKK